MAAEVIVRPRPVKRSFLPELSRKDQEELKDNKRRSYGKRADIRVPLFPEIMNVLADRFARHDA